MKNSIVLTHLDFDTYKANLKTFMQAQPELKDYDFDGSNISVLLDLLAYNTYQTGFYLNMVASESFIDSAQLRDSVVSHSKDLGYTPRSFSSARAVVNINIKSSNAERFSLTIPRGTKFSSKVGNDNFIFTTGDNISLQGDGEFLATNVPIYEGIVVSESYVSGGRYLINNARVDTSSIVVTVIEDNGSTILEYAKSDEIFSVDETTQVYFLQGAEDSKYEILFGNDILGRKPKENSLIQIEYRVSSGELPNGAKVFTPLSAISGETDITVTTVEKASSGSVSETIDEIKFNATRYYTTQERGVVAEDYENLLKINFPEINSVSAYGGEEVDPPKYGKVFIAVDLKELDFLPTSKVEQYQEFLGKRSPVSIEPIFVEADYLYVMVDALVKYNINKTSLSVSDIRSLVTQSILQYAEDNLNDFSRTLRYSKLLESIDVADRSIISNETHLKAYKKVQAKKLAAGSVVIDFSFPIGSVESNIFRFKGKQCYIKNDDDVLSIYFSTTKLLEVGSINKQTGIINLNSFLLDSLLEEIKVIVTSSSLDIGTKKSTIINIIASDITVDIERSSE